jgi:hypothetical protein
MTEFQCKKCGSENFRESEVRMSGGWLGSIFEIESKRFDTVSCENCGYTEFYSRKRSTGEKVADLFFG